MVAAASSPVAPRGDDDAAAADARNQNVRSVASVSSERSADRSLDELDLENDGNVGNSGSLKKDKKKDKKSGLLKGLFGSKKNKVCVTIKLFICDAITRFQYF